MTIKNQDQQSLPKILRNFGLISSIIDNASLINELLIKKDLFFEVQQKLQIIQEIYQDNNGYQISNNWRSQNNIQDKCFVYGEIKYQDFAYFLSLCDTENKIFYDIGSGSGKACFAAAILFNLKKSIGIEYISDFCDFANSLKEKLDLFFAKEEANLLKEKINFINDDITIFDFSDADIVFIHATCFNDEILESLKIQLNKLKIGSRAIIVTKELDLENFVKVFSGKFCAEWGDSSATIYEKVK